MVLHFSSVFPGDAGSVLLLNSCFGWEVLNFSHDAFFHFCVTGHLVYAKPPLLDFCKTGCWLNLHFSWEVCTFSYVAFFHFCVTGHLVYAKPLLVNLAKRVFCILAERCAHFLMSSFDIFAFSFKNLRKINVFGLPGPGWPGWGK